KREVSLVPLDQGDGLLGLGDPLGDVFLDLIQCLEGPFNVAWINLGGVHSVAHQGNLESIGDAIAQAAPARDSFGIPKVCPGLGDPSAEAVCGKSDSAAVDSPADRKVVLCLRNAIRAVYYVLVNPLQQPHAGDGRDPGVVHFRYVPLDVLVLDLDFHLSHVWSRRGDNLDACGLSEGVIQHLALREIFDTAKVANDEAL